MSEDTFISHLMELRDRLLHSLIAIGLVFLCLFPWASDLYDAAGVSARALVASRLEDDRDRCDHAVSDPGESGRDDRVPDRAAVRPLSGMGIRGAGPVPRTKRSSCCRS